MDEWELSPANHATSQLLTLMHVLCCSLEHLAPTPGDNISTTPHTHMCDRYLRHRSEQQHKSEGCKGGLTDVHGSFVFLFLCVGCGGGGTLHALPRQASPRYPLPMLPWFVCTSMLADLAKSGNQCFPDFARCSKALDVEVA